LSSTYCTHGEESKRKRSLEKQKKTRERKGRKRKAESKEEEIDREEVGGVCQWVREKEEEREGGRWR
jgi:hypothetical protein